MGKLPKNSMEIVNEIRTKTGNTPDIIIKVIPFLHAKIYVIFDEHMCDRTTINEYILEFLDERGKSRSKESEKIKDVLQYLESKTPTHKVAKIDQYDDLFYNLLSGFTIILVDGYDEALLLKQNQN
jgi:hypothetical protein